MRDRGQVDSGPGRLGESMIPRMSLVAGVAAAALVIAAVGIAGARLVTADGSARGAAVGSGSAIPFLQPWHDPSLEDDPPPAVAARTRAWQKERYERAVAESRIEPTAAGGCEPHEDRPGHTVWGPPTPILKPRVLGAHVEIVYKYPHLNQTLPCRPFTLSIVVYSGHTSATRALTRTRTRSRTSAPSASTS